MISVHSYQFSNTFFHLISFFFFLMLVGPLKSEKAKRLKWQNAHLTDNWKLNRVPENTAHSFLSTESDFPTSHSVPSVSSWARCPVCLLASRLVFWFSHETFLLPCASNATVHMGIETAYYTVPCEAAQPCFLTFKMSAQLWTCS